MSNKDLKYSMIAEFDKVMNQVEMQFGSKIKEHQYVSLSHEEDKIIVFEKGDLLFVFNFHPSKSFENYEIGTKWGSSHFIVFESDEHRFGGLKRLEGAHNHWFTAEPKETHKRPYTLKIYIPNRSV